LPHQVLKAPHRPLTKPLATHLVCEGKGFAKVTLSVSQHPEARANFAALSYRNRPKEAFLRVHQQCFFYRGLGCIERSTLGIGFHQPDGVQRDRRADRGGAHMASLRGLRVARYRWSAIRPKGRDGAISRRNEVGN